MSPPPPAFAAAEAVLNPAELFARTCAGCHAGGSNVVEPGATLRAPDLARAGLASGATGAADVDALYDVIYGGRRKMPGYGETCAPKGQCTFGARLSDEVIRSLAAYVAEQAAAGWPAGQ